MDALGLLPVAALTAGRIALGTVFLAAGVGKLRSGNTRFHAALLAYDLFPRRVAAATSRALPPLEIAIAALLVAGFLTRPSLALAIGLLATFSATVLIALLRGKAVPCGCFGRPEVRPLQRVVLVRNLALLSIAFVLLASPASGWTLDAIVGGR
jgi:uncharacterized membrane protein YphA (DoxX/SURF4 family)